jgi:hypothetical protein
MGNSLAIDVVAHDTPPIIDAMNKSALITPGTCLWMIEKRVRALMP